MVSWQANARTTRTGVSLLQESPCKSFSKIPKYPCLAMPDNILKLKCTENVRCWVNEAPIYHIKKKPKVLQIPQRLIFSCWSLIHNSPTNNTTTSRGRILGHWVPPSKIWACYIHPLFSEWQSEMWCFPKYTCLFSASQALWSILPRVWGRFWFVECRTSLLWKLRKRARC